MFSGNVVALGGAFLTDEVVMGLICADVLREEEAMAGRLEQRL